MITVLCRLTSERESVLKILESENAIFAKLNGFINVPVKAKSKIPITASGRVYISIDDTVPYRTVHVELTAPKRPILSAQEFINDNHLKREAIPEVYPFKLEGDPIELTKGCWYRKVSTSENFILDKPVKACYRGGNTFGIIACIKNREKPIIGSPNGSSVGDLFVKVKTPEKIVKMTKAELQKIISEKFGSNCILQIDL